MFSPPDGGHIKASPRTLDALQRERRLHEIRLLASNVAQLDSRIGHHIDAIAHLHDTCTVFPSSTHKSTIDLNERTHQFRAGVSKVLVLGSELEHNLDIIKNRLDSVRTAAAGCSEQIKLLDINVQKVQRARHVSVADAFLRSITRALLVIVSLFYLFTRAINRTKAKIMPSQVPVLNSDKQTTKVADEPATKMKSTSSGVFVGDHGFPCTSEAVSHKAQDTHGVYNDEIPSESANNNSSNKDMKMHLAFQNLEAMSQQIHKLQQMEMQDV